MKKILFGLTLIASLSACKRNIETISSPQGPKSPETISLAKEIKIENGRLKFNSVAGYEEFLSMPDKPAFVKTLPGSGSFVSFKNRKANLQNNQSRTINGCEVPDELVEDNPVFFDAMINSDGIVEIAGTLYRYDYCNEKVWVISSANSSTDAYYTDFMSGTERPDIVGWFYTYVDAIEAVGQGYTTMPDENDVVGNDVFERLTVGAGYMEHFYVKSDPEQPNYENVLMDGNLQYDKFAVYFHFYGKEKYRTACIFNWCTSTGGNREWNVSFYYYYHRKGQNNPQSGSGKIYPPGSGENKCDKTFYEGSRGLHDGRNAVVFWDVNNVYTKSVRVLRGGNPGSMGLIGTVNLPRYQYRNNYTFWFLISHYNMYF